MYIHDFESETNQTLTLITTMTDNKAVIVIKNVIHRLIVIKAVIVIKNVIHRFNTLDETESIIIHNQNKFVLT